MAKRLAEQLASKEHLLLDMSHELRSPLTRMKVQLEFLSDEEARTALRSEVTEMEAMVTAILEEARLRSSVASLNMEKVNLAELIQSLTHEFSERRPGVICGKLEISEVLLDREKIRIVLRNLLDNALKHISDDGDPVIITAERQNDTVTIVVEDHGEGISEAALPHIFEPFFRADSSRSRKTGGYGLGLSLCKAIIDAHNGHMRVSSTPGKGTRVSIQIPIA
jgi:signal transduction histidine kinase